MASTSPTRIDDELYESAKVVGRHMDRSASQQLAHWARIGRELEAGATVSVRAVADVLAGADHYDHLGAPEQAVVRTAWGERVAARLATLNLAATFAADGLAYVELDDDETVARRTPDPGKAGQGRHGHPSGPPRRRAVGGTGSEAAPARRAAGSVVDQQGADRRR